MALPPTRRIKRRKPKEDPTAGRFRAILRDRLTNPDLRSPAQFLADMRAEQSARQLSPQTTELLDRLERSIASKAR